MKTTSDTRTAIRESESKTIPNTTTSKDGRWRTFHKHAGLMQYVPSGVYFARAKVKDKGKDTIKRASLETNVFTTAKVLLPDKRRELLKPPAEVGTFKQARLLYENDLEADHTLAQGSKDYRKARVAALLKTWPGLDEMKLSKISETASREWAKRFSAKFDEQNFNNTLGTLRGILTRAGIRHDDNPAFKVKRLGVKPTELKLPEPEQFEKILQIIETAGCRQSHDCADLVRFLAYSGCRISEARQVTWADIDFERGEMKIHNAKRSRTSAHHELRFVPLIPSMRELLERLRREQNPKPTDRVCVLSECEKSLTNACGVKKGKRLTKKTKEGKTVELGIGIERITHHDLRHLFATRCIESGVDIPTVSRWLGHCDGGALAMKVYGHLRREHSASMAQKVTFGKPTTPENVVSMLTNQPREQESVNHS